MKFQTTLQKLRNAGACIHGYNQLVRYLQGKEFTEADRLLKRYISFRYCDQISVRTILESNGFDDALWALRCIDDTDGEIRKFAIWCARQVEHLMIDRRSVNALNVAERYANGLATNAELSAAWAAAWAAAGAAAEAAAGAAARAAAWDAARAAARAAARDAAWDAAWAAARAAAWAAAWAAAGAGMSADFARVVSAKEAQ